GLPRGHIHVIRLLWQGAAGSSALGETDEIGFRPKGGKRSRSDRRRSPSQQRFAGNGRLHTAVSASLGHVTTSLHVALRSRAPGYRLVAAGPTLPIRVPLPRHYAELGTMNTTCCQVRVR